MPTPVAEFVQPEEVIAPEAVPQTVTTVQPSRKSAKIKGTWTMYYGGEVYDFVDGHRYDIPLDLFGYLVTKGNVYDTL